jgi:hypothetical protein
MCDACIKGNHNECIGAECDCPTRVEDEAVSKAMDAAMYQLDGVSDNVFRALMSRNSPLTQIFMNGAGTPQVRAFIREVVTTYRATLQ